MPFGKITMMPLDFNLFMGISFSGQKLKFISDIHTRLDDVKKGLGTTPDDVVVMAKWLNDTFTGQTGFSDDEITRVF